MWELLTILKLSLTNDEYKGSKIKLITCNLRDSTEV